jgi:hypothetical protein
MDPQHCCYPFTEWLSDLIALTRLVHESSTFSFTSSFWPESLARLAASSSAIFFAA